MKSALLFALAAPLVFAANTFVGCLGQPTEDISNPFPDDTVAVADGVTQAACDVRLVPPFLPPPLFSIAPC